MYTILTQKRRLSNLKKFIFGLIIGIMTTISLTVFAAVELNVVENPFPVLINGQTSEVEGYNINGFTFLKLADFKQVGLTVKFNETDKQIEIISNNNEISETPENTIESSSKTINELDIYIVDGVEYVRGKDMHMSLVNETEHYRTNEIVLNHIDLRGDTNNFTYNGKIVFDDIEKVEVNGELSITLEDYLKIVEYLDLNEEKYLINENEANIYTENGVDYLEYGDKKYITIEYVSGKLRQIDCRLDFATLPMTVKDDDDNIIFDNVNHIRIQYNNGKFSDIFVNYDFYTNEIVSIIKDYEEDSHAIDLDNFELSNDYDGTFLDYKGKRYIFAITIDFLDEYRLRYSKGTERVYIINSYTEKEVISDIPYIVWNNRPFIDYDFYLNNLLSLLED